MATRTRTVPKLNLTPFQVKILLTLEKDGPLAAHEMKDKIGSNSHSIRTQLWLLDKHKLLRHHGGWGICRGPEKGRWGIHEINFAKLKKKHPDKFNSQ